MSDELKEQEAVVSPKDPWDSAANIEIDVNMRIDLIAIAAGQADIDKRIYRDGRLYVMDVTQKALDKAAANGAILPQDEKLAALAAYRYEVENAGITIDSIQIGTDQGTRANLTVAYIKAKENPDYTVQWKTDGGFMPLNAATIVAVADAVAEHVQKAFAVEAGISASIDSYGTVEDIKSVFDERMKA